MGASEKAPEPVEAAPSPSTSDEHVDEALDPGRVGPVKLKADLPESAPESKPDKVGPERLKADTPSD